MIRIKKGEQHVVIDGGELSSYRVGEYEYIHQKGSPGWGHSDTEMFPIIGPTEGASYRVQVPRGNAIQDQHGLLRDMKYSLKGQKDDQAIFIKRYPAGNLVKNSKYPDRSPVERLIWPYGFEFEKSFTLTDDGLKIEFAISGERDMPFMLGYHPAFKLRTPQPIIRVGERQITLAEVMAVGSRALLVPDCQELNLVDERVLRIKTAGFGHFMLWTEVPNMICIEPITFYPYAVDQTELHQGFEYLGQTAQHFTVTLQPAG